MSNTVADYYLRKDFAPAQEVAVADAAGLLRWGRSVSQSAVADAVYRDREGRRTLRFEQGGRAYFLKLHTGVGWREIVKNLLQGRLPVLGAANEYRAIRALERAGVETLAVAAFASQGVDPARRQSLVVTDALVDTVSLEEFCANWRDSPPSFGLRLRLIEHLADVARRMHEAGINHRDFYLCHFHLAPTSQEASSIRCHLIDLHRAQLRSRTPLRWRVKDLAGLYFSALDSGLGRRDCLRFVRHYAPGGLRHALQTDARFWRRVERRARKLYERGARG